MPKPPPASTRNPAFQSKLEPYREFIRECRAKRWSYPRIAAALWEDHGLSVAPSTIFSFVKVRAKRRRLYALPPSDEPRVVQPVQINSRAREFFSPPDPNPMKTSEDPTTSEILHRLVVPNPDAWQSRKVHRGDRALRVDDRARRRVEGL